MPPQFSLADYNFAVLQESYLTNSVCHFFFAGRYYGEITGEIV